MDIKTYISSGILELYATGHLSENEQKEVETILQKYPEAQEELLAIQKALEDYALINAIAAPDDLKQKVMSSLHDQIPTQNLPETNSKGMAWLNVALFAAAISGFVLFFVNNNHQKNEIERLKSKVAACDSIDQQNQNLFARLNDLRHPGNQIVAITATPGYANTHIYLHTNPQTGKNYLQLNQLPPLQEGQAYQLWSLKEGQNPIPMDVFDGSQTFTEVAFENNTLNYAITIEKAGGVTSPTLTRLIGTFKVS